jgi:hypothetical protein
MRKGSPAPDLVIAEGQNRVRIRQHVAQPFLPLLKRSRCNGRAVEVDEIEQEKDECFGVARV